MNVAHQRPVGLGCGHPDQQSPGQARDFLTAYTARQGERVYNSYRKLFEHLMWKYLDGNVRDEMGNVKHPPYPADWNKRIADERGDILKVKQVQGLAQDEE